MSVGSFLKTGVVVNQAQSFRFYGLEECKKENRDSFKTVT